MASTKQDPQATAQADDERDPKTRGPHCDVLVYNSRAGGCSCMWNDAPESAADKRVRIPQQRQHRVEPGLSFVPGELWEQVSKSSSWRHGAEAGSLRALAGQRGDLAAEWAKTRRAELRPAIKGTHGVAVLLRLQELEDQGPRRADVSDDLTTRLGDLKVRRAEYERKRRDQRGRHRVA